MTSLHDRKELLEGIRGLCRAEKPARTRHGFSLNRDPAPIFVVITTVDDDGNTIVHRCLREVHELRDFDAFSVRWQYDNVAVTFDVTHATMVGEHLRGKAHNITAEEGRNKWHETAKIDVTFEDGYIAIPQEIRGLSEKALGPSLF